MEPGNSEVLIWPQCLGASWRMPYSIISHGSELSYTGDWVQILKAFCKCWLQHLDQASSSCLPWYYTPGPGSLGIFRHFICWYRCTYTLPLESSHYILLSFLICQEDKGRWGVNRMHLWPLSARFTCPLHSEHRLFAFLPGVTPVLTGRQESLCTPGLLDSWISLSAAGNIHGDSSSWWILSAKPSAQKQDVIT